METERKVIDNSEIVKEEINKELLEEQIDGHEDLVDVLTEEIESWKDKYKYLLADLMNTKKRYQKLLDDTNKYKEESIAKDLISISDDFERMLNNEIDKDGVNLVYDKFINMLNKYDIKPIYEKRPAFFNDEYDSALVTMDVNDELLDNTIHDVIEKGYKYKDKILRYEKVVVNKYKQKE
jgi:molecular chaperone GrpE